MAYQVNKTDGTLLTTIFDGQTDSPTSPNGHSSLTLIGKQVSNFGELQNENFIHLLENFSNTTDPVFPLEGQLWWNKTDKTMNVFNGTAWHTVTGFVVAGATPSNSLLGDQWWDTTNDQYKVYNGTDWVTVGPAYSKLDSKSGAIVENIYDTGLSKHTIVSIYHRGNITAIISRDQEFTPNVSIGGFTTVRPGISFSSEVGNIKVYGTATNADTVGNLTPSQFLRSDIDSVSTANVSVMKNVYIGNNSELSLIVGGGHTSITNNSLNKNVYIAANVGGTLTNALTIDGTTGLVTVVANAVSNFGIPTKQYVDVSISHLDTELTESITSNVNTLNTTIQNNFDQLQGEIDTTNDAVALRATIDSPSFTGTPLSVTPSVGDNSTKIATTAFVGNAISSFDTTRVYNGSSQMKVNATTLVATANSAVVATFYDSGIQTITQSQNDNSTKVATTAYVDAASKNFILNNSSPYKPTCYVSQQAPSNAVGVDGDLWFRYQG